LKKRSAVHAVARDFAKLGQFIMQKGEWEGKQLISKEYCEKLLSPTKENDAFCYTIWADDESDHQYRFFTAF
jgi:CubicO group peptidase (beta-lactamase class C family)